MISNNTIEIAKRIISENTNMSIILPFIKIELEEEIITACNFLFNDDKEIKKDFSNYLMYYKYNTIQIIFLFIKLYIILIIFINYIIYLL